MVILWGPTCPSLGMMRFVPALLLAASLGAQSPSSDVAMGVFPFLVGNMDGRISEVVTNCQSRGIDTLYVSVFRATGPQAGSLWVTDSAGDWNPAWGSVRPGGAGINLASLIQSCHAANLRVVGVIKCFSDNVQPTDAAHRQYLLDVIDYFVDAWQPDGRPTYDLDGFALDYVRFVGSGTGNNPLFVTNFLADVRSRIGGMSLHCYLIANRYSFDGPTYNGVFNSYASTMSSLSSQFGQNWEQMARHADVLMPMSYTADGSIYNTYALHQAYVRKTSEYARQACTNAGFPGRRVCPVIRTYSDTVETTTDLTVEASITGALLGGGDGYQSFRYQHVVNNPSWWSKIQQFAVPGCNWPVPAISVTSPALTASLDLSLSRDADQSAATLDQRVDVDGDGVFDTPWQPLGTSTALVRHAGQWPAGVQVRDGDGHIAAGRRRFQAGSSVQVSPPVLSATSGGSVQVQVAPGPAASGGVYLVLATLAGTNPGFDWGVGFPVPINVDFLTMGLANQPNSGFMNGGLGILDAAGSATATLTVPAGLLQPLTGRQVHWSYLCADAFGAPMCVGDARPLLIFF
jgi:hypothetical protein